MKAATPAALNDMTMGTFYRGAIIASYAQVEFLLADLVFRWRDRMRTDGTFPYSLEERVKAARRVINKEECFAPYRLEFETLVKQLEPYRDVREIMAHAMVILSKATDGQPILDYRMYKQAKEGVKGVVQMTTGLEELADKALEISRFSHDFVQLWRRIYRDQGLKPVA